jgi:hypothetical protein
LQLGSALIAEHCSSLTEPLLQYVGNESRVPHFSSWFSVPRNLQTCPERRGVSTAGPTAETKVKHSTVLHIPVAEVAVPNEKATRQLGRPSLSRENSSNGAFIHQNFLRESYESEKRGVKQNFLIKYYYFQ